MDALLIQKKALIRNERFTSLPISPPSVKPDLSPLKILQPDSVEFSYEILSNKDIKEADREFWIDSNEFTFHGKIKNNSFSTVYLLDYSCSDIPGHLQLNENHFRINQPILCNMSWAIISDIKPGESYNFKTQLDIINGEMKLNHLGLTVHFVDRYLPFETCKENQDLFMNRNKGNVTQLISNFS